VAPPRRGPPPKTELPASRQKWPSVALGLGDLKNDMLQKTMHTDGVQVFEGSRLETSPLRYWQGPPCRAWGGSVSEEPTPKD
jgi:hypothetical protein